MATFSQWLKEQEARKDDIGQAAVAWASLTPGRISSVPGIERFLQRRIDDPLTSQDDLVKLKHTLTHMVRAAAEYEQHQDRERAIRSGAIPFTAPQPDNSSHPVAPAGQEAESDRNSDGSTRSPAVTGARYTGWPEERLNRIEGKLDLLVRIAGALASDSTAELMQRFGIAATAEESAERGVALWIRRDGSIDFELLFRMADLSDS